MLAERRLERSEKAREQAELLLEVRSHALAKANAELRARESDLLLRLEKDSLNLLSAQEVAKVATFHVSEGLTLIGSRNLPEILGTTTIITHINQVVDRLDPAEGLVAIRFLTGVHADSEGESQDLRFLDDQRKARLIRWHIRKSVGGFQGALHDITTETELALSLREQSQQLTNRVAELEALGHALDDARSRAVKADQAKSRFLAMMSHDIRTPMNAILAMLELLAVGKLTPEQAKMVNLALSSGNQMLFLLADIIEVARAEGWKLDLAEDVLALPEFLRSVSESWRQLAQRKGLNLDLEVAADLPAFIKADQTRLRQVLDNLISNAVKYTHKGGLGISCTVATRNGADMLHVAVTDTGVGISKADQEKLFKDLQRVTSPLQAEVEGTGLGLSICARIITAMQGKVGLESYEGHGSTFWFMVPLSVVASAAPSAASAQVLQSEEPLSINGAPPHILVAEDVETNRMVMQAVLDRFGCTYVMVNDGIEALKALGTAEFAAVLMDVSMPRLNGVETTQRIRAMQGAISAIPIIGVTAFAAEEEKLSLIVAGMNSIVTKPIKPAQLRSALAECFSQTQPVPSRSRIAPAPLPDFEGAPLLDVDALLNQLDSVPAELRLKLAQTVSKDLTQWHERFTQACEAGNAEAAARAHHALKGVCEGFGIRRYAAHLELARQCISAGAKLETGVLHEALAATLTAIEAHAATTAPSS